MPNEMEVTWGGSRDNEKGEIWLKFVAPLSEAAAATKCVLYTGKQVYLFAQWNGEEHQIAVAKYNGKTDTPEGEFKIGFRTDVNSIDSEMLDLLRKTVAGKTTFILSICTVEEVQMMLADQASGVAEEEVE